MDCYYHNAVPSVSLCSDCKEHICATCRGDDGMCPGCRLAQKIDDASRVQRELHGEVPPRPNRQAAPPPPPSYGPPQQRPTASIAVRTEMRALIALGYPFWPLALIALLDSKASGFVKKQAWQSLAFNFGMYGFGFVLHAIAAIPVLGWSAWPLLPFIVPFAFVANVIYGFKTWQGEDVRIPIVTDLVEERLPAT